MDIAIYVEGGGDTAQQKAELRRGLDALFGELKNAAKARYFGWKLVCCGTRSAAYDAFINALRTSAASLNILLVDSESSLPPETGNRERDADCRVAHLTTQDGWNLSVAQPERIHLMVQCMEAWIVADPEAVALFYGQGFIRNSLPARINLEEEPKADIYNKLKNATRGTQKGGYGKIRHASQLLTRIDPGKVAVRCPRFATLQDYLANTIAGA